MALALAAQRTLPQNSRVVQVVYLSQSLFAICNVVTELTQTLFTAIKPWVSYLDIKICRWDQS